MNYHHARLAFILLISQFSYGNEPTLEFDHISVSEGLSNQVVFDIIQDSQGYLWIGGEGGLDRYDGYHFKHFGQDENNPFSLTSNHISFLRESRYAGTTYLWIKTSTGLNRLNLSTERVKTFLHDPADSSSIVGNNIRAICSGDSGTIWIGTSKGLDQYSFESGDISHHLAGENIIELFQDDENVLWIATINKGLLRYSLDDGKVTRYQNDPGDNKSIGSDVLGHGIFNSEYYGKEYLWISTHRKGINLLDKQTGQFKRFAPLPNSPHGLAEIQFETHFNQLPQLWVRTHPMAFHILNLRTGQYSHQSYDPDKPKSLTIDLVHRIKEDRSGVIWVGTYLGLNRLNRQTLQFTNYTHVLNDPSSLSSNVVVSLNIDSQNKLWIGTTDGLNIMDMATGRISNFRNDPLFPVGLNSSIVGPVLRDSRGYLWIITNAGVFRLNPERDAIDHFKPDSLDPNSLSHRYNNTVIEDEDGNIWIAGYAGMDKYSYATNQFEHFLQGIETGGQLIPRHSAEPIILIATRYGLIVMSRESGEFRVIKHKPGTPQSISDNRIHAIHESANGILWVGTNNGLNRVDISKGIDSTLSFTHYFKKDGLPSSTVVGIQEDDSGKLWFSTAKGLSKYDPYTGTFRNYAEQDGLNQSVFIHRATAKDSYGNLYFGGLGGLTKFHPDSLQDNPHVPAIVLTDFKLFHQPVRIDPQRSRSRENEYFLPENISYLDSIILSYRENVFSLEFAALDYRNPLMNQYAYMLEGFDRDWIITDASNRRATYTNVEPGEYTFRAKGSNNDGLWNEEGVSLVIIITPPWWKTRTAYSGYFLLILSTSIAFYRLRIARLRLQYQAEIDHLEAKRYHEIDDLKSRFFANISHEFRTPLTLILGPISKLLSRTSDSESEQDLNLMQRQAKRLLELVTQLLDLSKLEAGKMKIQVSQRNIVPLLKGLTLSFASLAERDKIILSFNTELEDIQVFVEKDAISKIINNLLTNAFKFTESGGCIKVNVSTNTDSDISSEGEICIAITDSGIGIPAERIDKIFDRFYQIDNSETREREGTGIGLALTRELVELHQGSIGVKSEEGVGTTFTICLPLGSAHLSATDIIGIEADRSTESDIEQIPVEKAELGSTLSDESQPILLIVEDNADVRSYVKSYLDKEYTCYEAENGEEGLKQALEIIPDLIISDVMMPKMDGVEFCQRIKTDLHTSHIPMILLTAKADLESKLEGLEVGADSYLTKPFEAEELLVRIKNLIAQRVLLRQRFQQDLNLIPEDLHLSSMDEQFLKKATGIIIDQLQSSDFNVERFSEKIFMSRQHLNRKIKAITGRSTVDFIRSVRLKRAVILLQHRESTVTEIAYKVGFANPSHFTVSFQKEFGKTPKDYMAEYQKSQSNE